MAEPATRDPWELARRIERGLPFRSFVELRRELGLSREATARLVRIPSRTLARRQRERRLAPEESERVVRLGRVLAAAIELFEGDRDGARAWLGRANRALGGRTPLDACRTEVGAREVEALIGRLEHGVVS